MPAADCHGPGLLPGHLLPSLLPQLMTAGLCWCLLASGCAEGSLASGLTAAIFQLPLCRGGLVSHGSCDLPMV